MQVGNGEIIHSLFKCTPLEIRISITSILRYPAELLCLSFPLWEADASRSPALPCFGKGTRCERAAVI